MRIDQRYESKATIESPKEQLPDNVIRVNFGQKRS